MLHLCLDANTLLSLCEFSPADLAEVEKIPALVREGQLALWLPEVVIDEYRRNRAKVIAEAIRAFRGARLSIPLPVLSLGVSLREELLVALKETQRAHADLLSELEERAALEDLAADNAAQSLMRAASVPSTGDVLALARLRRELRRPPGKADSLGDAIVWECLLEAVPRGEDIYLVSADTDFQCRLSPPALHDYLANEWFERKGANAFLHTSLGHFLKEKFPSVRVPSDIPKARLIDQLGSSGSFRETHQVVAKLATYDVFSPEQAAAIARHAVRNEQVRWIAADEDVSSFLVRVVDAHREVIDQAHLSALELAMTQSGFAIDDGKH